MERFREVAKLDTAALRGLLERGRPEQQVWAIWALALRTDNIAAYADRVHDPGVRRTLAVTLAGHGEYDLLVELARRDPSSAVRESAMQLVTRLAAQGALDAQLVIDASRDDRPVRPGILAAIDRGAPDFLLELASNVLRHGSPAEQAEAFEALLRTEARDVTRTAIAWLTTLDDERARDACQRMVRVVGEYQVASELAAGPNRLRAVALDAMTAPAWPTVELLVGDDLELLLAVVRRGKIAVPLSALARAALDGHATPLIERLTADLEFVDAPSDELRPLLALLDDHYGAWIATLDRELSTLRSTARTALPERAGAAPDPDDLRARRDARTHLVRLRKQIQRLRR